MSFRFDLKQFAGHTSSVELSIIINQMKWYNFVLDCDINDNNMLRKEYNYWNKLLSKYEEYIEQGLEIYDDVPLRIHTDFINFVLGHIRRMIT